MTRDERADGSSYRETEDAGEDVADGSNYRDDSDELAREPSERERRSREPGQSAGRERESSRSDTLGPSA
jgi:hypothetical protein